MYSKEVMEHFTKPRNVGEIEHPDGVGEVGNPVCGDMMTFHITVKDGKIDNVKFKTFGCGAAIAVSSMVSEMAMGRTLDEALKITKSDVAKKLGGLPTNKMHCSNLGADALHEAIADYLQKQGKPIALLSKSEGEEAEVREPVAGCACPYCDSPVDPEGATCAPCGKSFRVCPECGKPMRAESAECPSCGAAVTG
ncbi:MAG: iron-sulfur cluster assembly scaffold protein [Candidatus Eisenbacteria sp.]|nr:iron-sulfur cluster assembly scaffold protein [Candidatus Eisenbacteria bacterium]